MTIQLEQIIPPFLSMTTEEQLLLVKEIRHIKYVLKPDVKKRKAKAVKKTSVAKSKKAKNTVDALMKGLTKEQILELMKDLRA